MSKFYKNLTVSVFFVTFILVTGFVFDFYKNAEAQGVEDQLFGTAWSENIGWISFNYCTAPDENCGSVPYLVTVNSQNGHITGEAWSSNIGWLKFGGLSRFPVGQGTESDNAKANLSEGTPSSGKLEGWIRFCAGTLTGDCSTMTNSPDGWDGWVSLSGDLHPVPDLSGNSGVTYDYATGRIAGKAWGGDVVGWIDFFDVWLGPPPVEPQPFDYDLTNPTSAGSPASVSLGGSGSTAVTRNLISGDSEPISLVIGSLPADIDVSINDNQPCNPTCASSLTITDTGAGSGSYSFEVTGDVLIEGEERVTEVWFEIAESEPIPEISCEAQEEGPFFLPPSVVINWEASIENPIGDEEFFWQGDDDLICEDQPSTECQIAQMTYTMPGRKEARVSIDGGDNFIECTPEFIGVNMNFTEF